MKRTNLNNAHEVDDFRAAISYLQGEPGVDPDRIGIWGSSNAGSVVIAVAAIDARAKAVVAQVAGPRPAPRGPAPSPDRPQAVMVDDAIKRARTGQGAEVDGGFSFRSKIDLFGNFRNRDVRPGLDARPDCRDDEGPVSARGEGRADRRPRRARIEATKYLNDRGVTAQTIVYPELTHFQAYSNTGFDVGSTLAAEWFLKYLGPPVPAKPSTAAQVRTMTALQWIATKARKHEDRSCFVLSCFRGCYWRSQRSRSRLPLPTALRRRDVKFFSEAVQCYAKIFLPKGFTRGEQGARGRARARARCDTAASIDKYAAQLAARGLVAMAIDYRGWGKSGGFLYLAEPVRWDDRLRFSQHTANVRIRRKRLIPEAQILDIRNAISYLQGEPGVDRARIGVWGADLAGGHVIDDRRDGFPREGGRCADARHRRQGRAAQGDERRRPSIRPRWCGWRETARRRRPPPRRRR